MRTCTTPSSLPAAWFISQQHPNPRQIRGGRMISLCIKNTQGKSNQTQTNKECRIWLLSQTIRSPQAANAEVTATQQPGPSSNTAGMHALERQQITKTTNPETSSQPAHSPVPPVTCTRAPCGPLETQQRCITNIMTPPHVATQPHSSQTSNQQLRVNGCVKPCTACLLPHSCTAAVHTQHCRSGCTRN